MTQLRYTNIFDAITDDPAEAAALQLRANLMLRQREAKHINALLQREKPEVVANARAKAAEILLGVNLLPLRDPLQD